MSSSLSLALLVHCSTSDFRLGTNGDAIGHNDISNNEEEEKLSLPFSMVLQIHDLAMILSHLTVSTSDILIVLTVVYLHYEFVMHCFLANANAYTMLRNYVQSSSSDSYSAC